MNKYKFGLKIAGSMAIGDSIVQFIEIQRKHQNNFDLFRFTSFTLSSLVISQPILQTMGLKKFELMTPNQRKIYLSLFSFIPFSILLIVTSLNRNLQELSNFQTENEIFKFSKIPGEMWKQIKRDLYPLFLFGGSIIPVTTFVLLKRIPPKFHEILISFSMIVWSMFISHQIFQKFPEEKKEK